MRSRLATATPADSSSSISCSTRRWRQHHAIADVAGDAFAQDARGNQPQDRLLAVDDQRMAGIVSALEAHHAICMVGEPVDDLALALVTPLGADHYHVLCHARSKKREFRIAAHGAQLCANFSYLPFAFQLDEFARAAALIAFVFVPGQFLNHHLARCAQARHAASSAGSLARGARMQPGAGAAGARRAKSSRYRVKPVAGRARPKALPTPS